MRHLLSLRAPAKRTHHYNLLANAGTTSPHMTHLLAFAPAFGLAEFRDWPVSMAMRTLPAGKTVSCSPAVSTSLRQDKQSVIIFTANYGATTKGVGKAPLVTLCLVHRWTIRRPSMADLQLYHAHNLPAPGRQPAHLLCAVRQRSIAMAMRSKSTSSSAEAPLSSDGIVFSSLMRGRIQVARTGDKTSQAE